MHQVRKAALLAVIQVARRVVAPKDPLEKAAKTQEKVAGATSVLAAEVHHFPAALVGLRPKEETSDPNSAALLREELEALKGLQMRAALMEDLAVECNHPALVPAEEQADLPAARRDDAPPLSSLIEAAAHKARDEVMSQVE